nr:FRAS1-related extracellular matrix protein 2-like isoform X2 [Procambarus clarkii]
MGGRLGHNDNATVTILPDHKDVPAIFFGESVYHVDESVGSLEVTIWRSGTDLSREATVQVASRALSPPQAQAGYDYVAVGRQVDFRSGVRVQSVTLTVMDDLGRPTLEGVEALTLLLHLPCNASLGDPAVASVLINDSLSDLPKFEFREDNYTGYEGGGTVTAWITRGGDPSHPASVRCFTRQGTARVTEDFDERPDAEASSVHFQPGELERPCMVIIVDDDVYEGREQLHLALGSPASPSAGGARLGPHTTTTIFINDKADKTTVGLEESRVSVEEPEVAGEERVVRLVVFRTGDTSTSVAVRIHTKDGSATSGKDYFPVSKEVVFAPNVTRVMVEVTVLGDAEKEHREAFTVHLKPLRGSFSASNADITTSKAIVYIEEMNIVADVTFPAPPVLVSLRDYDVASSAPAPIPGYPIICVTACNSRHPDFGRTSGLCSSEGVNDSFTTFRWKVAAPSGLDGFHNDLKDVSSDTFFTSTRTITLDSIYFSAGSRVQCLARAHSGDGEAGLELASRPVTVAWEGGLCPPRKKGTFGADPFTAKLQYTGTRDPSHANMVRLEVVIPHRDGMVPVLSTRQLVNFQLTLSRDGIRIGNHRCSNLLDFHEVRTQRGFVTNMTRGPEVLEELEPYQHSLSLRSPPTLRFYRALEVEACVWRWVGYYTMTELVSQCGGVVATEGQVLDAVQSFVSVLVPLYVSYVFHSPVATGGWQHTDLSTRLSMSFVYDTAILWRQGIGAPAESELAGVLYPTSMRLRPDGRLVVTCRTQPRFRGIFVEKHKASEHISSVTSDDHPDLTFSLDLLRSQPTYAHPEQHWQFVSNFAVRDYSGSYVVHLLACTVVEDVLFSQPLVCNPRHLIPFLLQVRFQQVSDPVPEQFTLSTLFHLMRQRELWLSDLTTDFEAESDVSFFPGDRIYGRVMINPVQALGAGFRVTLEKCFVCTGVDGYVPKYNPETSEYGCVADSPNLLHNFKIIDRGAPETVSQEYLNVGFNARLAIDDPEPDVIRLLNQPGADGFSLDSSPLFQESHGRQWFVHCIYTVLSEEKAARGIGKRDVTAQAASYHHALSTVNDIFPWANRSHLKYRFSSSYGNVLRSSHDSSNFEKDSKHADLASEGDARVKRANLESLPGRNNGRGTNMHCLALQPRRHTSGSSLHNQGSEFRHIGVVSGVGCVVVFLTSIVAMVVVRSRRGEVISSGYIAVSPATTSGHVGETRYYHTCEENTEV